VKSIGFGSEKKAHASDMSSFDVLRQTRPEDLIKFGLIPELVGRLQVVTSVEPLNQDDLVRILVEPRNALTKQYERLFALDNVVLSFSEDGLAAAAELAMRHETGARGLRSIIESCLLDVMFEIPGRTDVGEVVITRDVIEGHVKPVIVTRDNAALDWKDDGTLDTAA